MELSPAMLAALYCLVVDGRVNRYRAAWGDFIPVCWAIAFHVTPCARASSTRRCSWVLMLRCWAWSSRRSWPIRRGVRRAWNPAFGACRRFAIGARFLGRRRRPLGNLGTSLSRSGGRSDLEVVPRSRKPPLTCGIVAQKIFKGRERPRELFRPGWGPGPGARGLGGRADPALAPPSCWGDAGPQRRAGWALIASVGAARCQTRCVPSRDRRNSLRSRISSRGSCPSLAAWATPSGPAARVNPAPRA